jgi:hypothetical protein
LGIAAAVLLVGGLAFAYTDLDQQQAKLAQVQLVAQKNKVAVSEAKLEIARYETADAWLRMDRDKTGVNQTVRSILFDQMMLELTQMFPRQGNTIWATDVACKVSDPYTWEVKGKAVNQTWPDQVKQGMLQNERFADAKLAISEERASGANRGRGGANQTLFNWVLQFTYKGPGWKPPATAPSKAAPKKDEI